VVPAGEQEQIEALFVGEVQRPPRRLTDVAGVVQFVDGGEQCALGGEPARIGG
jgi:hypothetical protein